ncbi:MAG: 16S rRNA (cytosine(1402)-N(4))-methyltransferase RsmH [Acidobacteriia bacterium]|nr:16S rRNA (cytosine(1402)-N(4))-methyltransferase RsmH [Terriglobia bacterium]
MHVSVMPAEVLEYLSVRPEGIYMDATAGMGGHTALIAARLSTGLVIANDRDPESLEMARRNTAAQADRIRFHQGRFGELAQALKSAGTEKAAGLVADLGVSRYQLTEAKRGFSFLSDGPLDMRMDQTTGMTAADLVNHTAEKALADLIFQWGEERRARKIARAIVRARPIRSTLHLAGVVERAVPRTGKLHPATKTFMALRLAVNEEPEELDRLLAIGPGLLVEGGRMVIISFMSIDDRKVKERFRELGREGRARILTKHPIQPADQEKAANPASRSAKLRALEIL